MKLPKNLKSKYARYAISALILGIAVFFLVMLHRYDGLLEKVHADTQEITRNKVKIEQQVREIDTTLGYLSKKYNLEAASVDPETRIFQTVDHMREFMNNAVIRVDKYESTGNPLIPVTIMSTIEDYYMLVRYLQYLESLSIPRYKIKHLSIREGGVGEMVLTIEGTFQMVTL